MINPLAIEFLYWFGFVYLASKAYITIFPRQMDPNIEQTLVELAKAQETQDQEALQHNSTKIAGIHIMQGKTNPWHTAVTFGSAAWVFCGLFTPDSVYFGIYPLMASIKLLWSFIERKNFPPSKAMFFMFQFSEMCKYILAGIILHKHFLLNL